MLSSRIHLLSTKFVEKYFRSKHFVTTSAHQQNDKEIEPSIIVEKDTHITLIGINREATRNSIDSATADNLNKALQEFENDDTSPVAVLYGVGGSFSAGYDLQELEQQTERGQLDFLMKAEGGVGPTRRHLRKPVVCGINGFCVAAGLELALLCDLRVMEDSAILGFFNRRLGVPIADGGTARLVAAIGYSRALDLIVTGRKVTGREALNIGLINRLVATGTALGQAVNLAFSIGKFPMAALRHDRSSLYARVHDKCNFRTTIKNEMVTSPDIVAEMDDGIRRFKESILKGAKSNSWSIKEKSIPEWEKVEIAYEEAHANMQNKSLNVAKNRNT